MARYNTGNAIPSDDLRDFSDNSKTSDIFVNGDELTTEGRLGKCIRTIAGINAEFDESQTDKESRFSAFLASSGYDRLGDYAAGIEITEYNQIFRHEDEWWRASASLELPYTTTGDWGAESSLFVGVGDNVLRQELASPAGSNIIGLEFSNSSTPGTVAWVLSALNLESVGGLSEIAVPSLNDGIRAIVTSYWSGMYATMSGPVGGGNFVYDSLRSNSDHNGGTIISPTVPFPADRSGISEYLDGSGETNPGGFGVWVRTDVNITIESFGSIPNDSLFNNSPSINKSIKSTIGEVSAGSGVFTCSDEILMDGNDICKRFVGAGKTQTVFSFPSAGPATNAFALADEENTDRGFIGGFTIRGNREAGQVTGVVGLRLNKDGTIARSVTRYTFDDIMIENCAIGMVTAYAWTLSFNQMEIRQCAVGWQGGNQTNVALFNQCTFLNVGVFFTLQNCEGIQMDSPTIQNLLPYAGTIAAIWIRQSTLILNNPYFENMEGEDLVLLGGSGDQLPCYLEINGGIAPGNGVIRHRQKLEHIIKCSGPRINIQHGPDFRIGSTEGFYSLGSASSFSFLNGFQGLKSNRLNAIEAINPQRAGSFGVPNATNVTQDAYSARISWSGATWRYVKTGLTVGKSYTIVAMMRQSNSSAPEMVQSLRWRSGGADGTIIAQGLSDLVQSHSESWSVRYLPVIAAGDTLDLYFTGGIAQEIVLFTFRIYEGTVFPEVDPFS